MNIHNLEALEDGINRLIEERNALLAELKRIVAGVEDPDDARFRHTRALIAQVERRFEVVS